MSEKPEFFTSGDEMVEPGIWRRKRSGRKLNPENQWQIKDGYYWLPFYEKWKADELGIEYTEDWRSVLKDVHEHPDECEKWVGKYLCSDDGWVVPIRLARVWGDGNTPRITTIRGTRLGMGKERYFENAPANERYSFTFKIDSKYYEEYAEKYKVGLLYSRLFDLEAAWRMGTGRDMTLVDKETLMKGTGFRRGLKAGVREWLAAAGMDMPTIINEYMDLYKNTKSDAVKKAILDKFFDAYQKDAAKVVVKEKYSKVDTGEWMREKQELIASGELEIGQTDDA